MDNQSKIVLLMSKINILWVDDEISLLKPHVMFLEERGYTIATASNGNDALTMIQERVYDLVFLDENMPGLSGLETLGSIKNSKPNLPVIMVTKSDKDSQALKLLNNRKRIQNLFLDFNIISSI